jgi:uncharacterized protein YecT (DUF1311 family)
MMKIRGCLLFFMLLQLLSISSAQEEKAKLHTIDKTLEACSNKNPSTAGERDCIEKAGEMWDRELNRAYNELSGKLNPKGRQALKEAQLEWIKYRDTEFKLIDTIHSTLEGTMYIPMHAFSRMEIVKKRALELQSYLDLLKIDQP